MEKEERQARKMIAISAAARAFQYKERFPESSEREVLQHVTDHVDEILSKIDEPQ